MARVEDCFYTLLAAQAAVTAIVGTAPVRIVPDPPAQDLALPRIVFWKQADRVEYYSGAEARKGEARIAVECQAATVGGAAALASAVRAALSGYQGTAGSLRFSGVFLRDETDSVAPAVHGDEKGTPGKLLEFEVHYGV